MSNVHHPSGLSAPQLVRKALIDALGDKPELPIAELKQSYHALGGTTEFATALSFAVRRGLVLRRGKSRSPQQWFRLGAGPGSRPAAARKSARPRPKAALIEPKPEEPCRSALERVIYHAMELGRAEAELRSGPIATLRR